MTDKLPDVWAARDFPVLKAITAAVDQGAHAVALGEVADATGLEPETVALSWQALARRGLVTHAGRIGGPGYITGVSGDAYLLTGLHPDGNDALEALASMFRQAADKTSDPEEKGRLRKVASALGDVGGQLTASLMASFIAHQGGFG